MEAKRREFFIRTCMVCYKDLPAEAGFPHRFRDVCWSCFWKVHMAEYHPPTLSEKWLMWKEIRKRNKVQVRKEFRDARNERAIESAKDPVSKVHNL